MPKKRVTSQDVANLAGVSRTTVSFVLNDVKGFNISAATRQRVREAAENLNYIPDATAQALASRRAKAIGLVMTRSPHHIATDTFLPQIIGGMMEVVKDNKLRLLIEYMEAEHQDRAYLEVARSKHIDGMILLTPRLDDAGLKKLEQVDVPFLPVCGNPIIPISIAPCSFLTMQNQSMQPLLSINEIAALRSQ